MSTNLGLRALVLALVLGLCVHRGAGQAAATSYMIVSDGSNYFPGQPGIAPTFPLTSIVNHITSTGFAVNYTGAASQSLFLNVSKGADLSTPYLYNAMYSGQYLQVTFYLTGVINANVYTPAPTADLVQIVMVNARVVSITESLFCATAYTACVPSHLVSFTYLTLDGTWNGPSSAPTVTWSAPWSGSSINVKPVPGISFKPKAEPLPTTSNFTLIHALAYAIVTDKNGTEWPASPTGTEIVLYNYTTETSFSPGLFTVLRTAPISITKNLDSTTPLFYKAYRSKQPLGTIRFYFHVNPYTNSGPWAVPTVPTYMVTLYDARVTEIFGFQYCTAYNGCYPNEVVSLLFSFIEYTFLPVTDTTMPPPVGYNGVAPGSKFVAPFVASTDRDVAV